MKAGLWKQDCEVLALSKSMVRTGLLYKIKLCVLLAANCSKNYSQVHICCIPTFFSVIIHVCFYINTYIYTNAYTHINVCKCACVSMCSMCLCEYIYLLLFLAAYIQPSSGKLTGFPSDTCITDRIVNYFQHWGLIACVWAGKSPGLLADSRFISRFQVQFACNLLTKKVHHSSPDCHSESSIVFSSVLICISCVLLRNADHHAEQFSILLLQSFSYQAMRRLLTPLCWKHIK